MSETRSVFIFGYSGHAYVIIESLLDAGYKIKGYFDHKEASKNPYQLPYMGFERNVDVKSIVKDHFVFPTIGENGIREQLVEIFDELNLKQFTAIDPSANISKTANIGRSTYIGKNVIVNAQATIGRGAIINTQATIEHECNIEDFVHIAPGTVICGNVKVGRKSFVGANSVARENISIISDTLVGAGSVLIKSVEIRGIWVGNPAKKI